MLWELKNGILVVELLVGKRDFIDWVWLLNVGGDWGGLVVVGLGVLIS